MKNIKIDYFKKNNDEKFTFKIIIKRFYIKDDIKSQIFFLIYEEILKYRVENLLKCKINLDNQDVSINFNIKGISMVEIYTEINLLSDCDLSKLIVSNIDYIINEKANILEFNQGIKNIIKFLNFDLSRPHYLFNSYLLFFKYGLIPIEECNKNKFISYLSNIRLDAYTFYMYKYINDINIIILK